MRDEALISYWKVYADFTDQIPEGGLIYGIATHLFAEEQDLLTHGKKFGKGYIVETDNYWHGCVESFETLTRARAQSVAKEVERDNAMVLEKTMRGVNDND